MILLLAEGVGIRAPRTESTTRLEGLYGKSQAVFRRALQLAYLDEQVSWAAPRRPVNRSAIRATLKEAGALPPVRAGAGAC